MPSYVVDMYCGGFGEITEKKERGQGEYVVCFKDKNSKSIQIVLITSTCTTVTSQSVLD